MRRRPLAALPAAAAAALLLAACTAAPAPTGGAPTTLPALSSTASASGEPASDPALAAFYDQRVTWTDCGGGVRCTTVQVPVDWAAPDGARIGLAVAERPAADTAQRLGALLVNPGGPGASGVAWVKGGVQAVVSSDVAARYDVVGFDPRGTGASSPVDCVGDAEFDAYRADDDDASTAEGLAALTAADEDFALGCQVDAGTLLGHLGTVDAARDLDVLRAVVGSERLDYLGKSYGTLLGAAYAGEFPQRVGRVVLDGAMDPASSATDVVQVQAAGLESALRAYAAACPDRSGCDLGSTADSVVGKVRAVLEGTRSTPLATGDAARPLTGPLAFSGIIATLYDEASWPLLDRAVDAARGGDGSRLLQLSDAYAGRLPDGRYTSNLLEAYTAITCLDRPVDASPEAMALDAAQLAQRSPTFGPSMAYGAVQCSVWPVSPTRVPAPVTAAGAAPILVVGTTNDPATPYVWAQSLATQLASGRLLTWDGQGHTAYRRGSACVDGAVDAYLLDAVLPGQGATCTS